MHADVKKILFTEQQIIERCKEIGKQLTDLYKDTTEPVLVVGILKGSVPFMAELIKHMEFDFNLDFMAVSSYNGTESVGAINIKKDLDAPIVNKHIIIVEDIVDTGLTLSELKQYMYLKGAKDVKIVTLLNKRARRDVEIEADYVCFDVDNEFVIGYGLDFNQKYRNLPYVGVLKDELY